MPERLKLAGVALCKPYEQGDLDNLCGIYAALNAICLVAAPIRPLSRVEAEKVFHAGLRYLERRRGLADTLREGMEYRRQHAVTRHLARSASTIAGASITVEPVFPRGRTRADPQTQMHHQFMSGITERLDHGSALILELRKTWHHYTVIVGISPSRVLLFDSDGLKWVERRAVATTPNCDHRRHFAHPASLLAVTWEGYPKGRSVHLRLALLVRLFA
jgi:hypothetical protein